MGKFSKFLLPALMVGFFLFGLSAFIESKPSHKNSRIYKAVQQYSPYYFEKRFGGLEIRSKTDTEFKEKPSNMEVFKAFEQLERAWGQKHLAVKNGALLITDNNGTVHTLPIKNEDERRFIQNYYGVQP